MGIAGGSVSNSILGFVIDPMRPIDSFTVIRPFDVNSGSGKFGYGFEGGAGINISFIPFAKSIDDLGGKEFGVGGSGSLVGVKGSYEAGWSPGVGPSFSAGIGFGGGFSFYGYTRDSGSNLPIKINANKEKSYANILRQRICHKNYNLYHYLHRHCYFILIL